MTSSLPSSHQSSSIPQVAGTLEGATGQTSTTHQNTARTGHDVSATTLWVLLFAIPACRRDGKCNTMWDSCHIMFSSDGGVTFEKRPMERLHAGIINGDIMFRVVLPALTREGICADTIPSSARDYSFYLQDDASDDCDPPKPCCVNGFDASRNCDSLYSTLGTGLHSLRDGELADGDRVTAIGITIKLPLRCEKPGLLTEEKNRVMTLIESRGPSFSLFGDETGGGGWGGGRGGGSVKDERYAPTGLTGEKKEVDLGVADSSSSYWLHYLDESDCAWKYRQFDQRSCVHLPTARSVTFCVRNTFDSTWIQAPEDTALRIPFAGTYILFPNGSIFDCCKSVSSG
eukprot:GHVU01068950.1.p1 GENE.GHVU01068950.1~~GHVU01068950.1.p1  ORF type:complete len:366 (+),score=26.34 GHVU01068950.1:68-1099(+)